MYLHVKSKKRLSFELQRGSNIAVALTWLNNTMTAIDNLCNLISVKIDVSSAKFRIVYLY